MNSKNWWSSQLPSVPNGNSLFRPCLIQSSRPNICRPSVPLADFSKLPPSQTIRSVISLITLERSAPSQELRYAKTQIELIEKICIHQIYDFI